MSPRHWPALVAILVLSLSSAVSAQSLTANQLLEKSAQAYRALSSYRDRAVIRMEVTFKGEDGKSERNTTQFSVNTAFQRPNRLRLEVDSPDWPSSLVFDGKRRTYYIGSLKEYAGGPASDLKTVLREGFAQFILGPVLMTGFLDELAGANGAQAFSETPTEARLVDTDKVDGRQCQVVEIQRSVQGVPLAPEVRTMKVPFRIALDKEDFLARRIVIDFAPMLKELAKAAPDQVPTSMVLVAEHHDVRPNAPVSEADFTFSPPEGAKQVVRFSDRRLALVFPAADMVGKPAPPLDAKDLMGGSFSLASLKGKVVLLHFWSTRCKPCVEEIPTFVQLYDQYQSRGLAVVGVSIGDPGPEVVGPWSVRAKMRYPVIFGNAAIQSAFGGFQDLPTNFLIDRDGVIRYQFNGKPRDLAVYEQKILELLDGKPAPPPTAGQGSGTPPAEPSEPSTTKPPSHQETPREPKV